MEPRKQIAKARRWVIKVGSALLTDNGRALNHELIDRLVSSAVNLKKNGIEISLVSSGAVAEGMRRLGWSARPRALYQLQAAAALGQMGLIQAYESSFQKYQIHTAQVLLTHDDLTDRQRYLNARSTIRTLLAMNVVPVINENDTVATDEIRFGDNDTLAGLVSNLIEAELLVLLTDQPGFYEQDPHQNPDAPMVHEANADDPRLEQMAAAGGVGRLGSGGMVTKIRAARLAARSGTMTIIAGGREERILEDIARGEDRGTLLLPGQGLVSARKRWLAGHLKTRGEVVIDDGAVNVLRQLGRSLLPVGVTGVEGDFERGEMVLCVDQEGRPIARGLINYSATDARKIAGQPSHKIEALLGYVDEPELIHRDNLVIL